ncbi:MAG: alpha/beta fold hydrolase [Acidobacteria bacterium]|nr:alpha/beta fold hydrolase [Acidobacteriota bacterium]
MFRHRFHRLLPLLLPFTLTLLAEPQQRKPVTLEAVGGQRPSFAPRANWSPLGKEFVYTEAGKLMLYEASSKKAKELVEMKKLEALATKPAAAGRFDWQNRRVSEKTIQWMPNGRDLLLIIEGDLFLFNTDSKKHEQLTATATAERDPKPSPDGKRLGFRIDHDLYTMEIASKKVTRLTTDGSANILNGELDWVYPEELDLGTAWWWSPDSSRIAFMQFDTTRLGTYPHADLLGVTAFAEPQKYPKTGTQNSDVRLGVVAATGGSTKWMDVGEMRDHLLARVNWIPESNTLAVQKMTRVQNKLDFIAADASTGASKVLFTEKDATWINVADDLTFLPSRKQFLWSSEKTGFRHLYLMSYEGQEVKRLTSGEWEVSDVLQVDEKAGKVYFTSTEVSPLERQLYVVDLNSGEKKALTSAGGTHSISMSPAADFYLDTHSSLKTPPRTTLHKSDGAEVAVFREADRKVIDEFALLPTEVVKVTSADGALMYARLIKPANFDPAKKYPAVVFVYGGPHAQTVRDSWVGLSWEQALAHKGFVIWQLDNRGSGGRGHAWESKLYRRMGKQELEDQKAGVDHLLKMGFVDSKRIGINGWSYGGYMTLYALLNAPEVFAAGISGAPVVDWRHYDTIYTERYLGMPQENESGYKDSSALTYAGNLKGKLLLVHNFGDDNVLFQNSFQMADALQKAGKQFEMMIYPQKSHGVSGPAARQMREMMTNFLERSLGVTP